MFAVTPLGGRFADAFDLGHGTTRGRFDDWTVGARVVEDHPLFGVGPEGYRVVFPQVVSATYVERHGTAVIPDRAHNGVLDVATSGGLVGGAPYAALLATVVAIAWRAMRGRDPIAVALACAVVAYVVQQQFLFPLSELDPLFWVAAGTLFAARTTMPAPAGRRIPRVVPVLVAACVLFAAFMGAREVVAGAEGAPPNGQFSSVTVGADHIDVSYEVPTSTAADGAASSNKLVELVGTPKA